MLSRQLPTRPLPVSPVSLGYCGRNRRFVLCFHIEHSLESHHFSRTATSSPIAHELVFARPCPKPPDVVSYSVGDEVTRPEGHPLPIGWGEGPISETYR